MKKSNVKWGDNIYRTVDDRYQEKMIKCLLMNEPT